MSYSDPPSALLTDLYQLTMAQGYFTAGVARTEACFHLFFRENPFGGGFAVAAGLEQAIQWLEDWRITPDEISYLRTCRGNDGEPLFGEEFLTELAGMRFDGDVDAIPEGTVVFPREPLMRIRGSLPLCQLVETALLTIVNFQTLIATKAARCRISAGTDPVMEFGLRRAQGPDGGVSGSRAAYVGGADSTSNVLAGQRFGIPVSGTHAHSWVMAFDSETDAFEAYAEAMPNNVTLLVDTYDALEGVRRAAAVGLRMRERGEKLVAVRIDSGDLAWLSIRARRILDEAGLPEVKIVASNELDEHLIASLKDQGAAIDGWGVGTKLVTGGDQSALGGVYKLSAIRRAGEDWKPRLKVTEQAAKATLPGVLGVRRYYRQDGSMAGDMIYDEVHGASLESTMVDPTDATRRKSFDAEHTCEEMLVPVFRDGRLVYELPVIADIRNRALAQVEGLDPTIRRFVNPHDYPVGVERMLHDLQTALVLKSKGIAPEEAAPSPLALAEADAMPKRGERS